MAASRDTWNVYESYNPFTNYLGSFQVEEFEEQVTLSTKLSNAGISIPQGAIGIYYQEGIIGLNDIVPFISGVANVNTAFAYLQQPETITGFYLDGTEYKFEGGGTEYTAGNGIDITNDEIGLDGTYEGDSGQKDYSAMRGPAPSGFHVPLTTEWKAVRDIRVALGGRGSSAGTNFGIALKLPFAGSRVYNNSNVYYQGTYGHYWSSSRYTSNANYSYYLYFYSSNVHPQNNDSRANGFSVRCFKNSPTVPTSSWTKLYGTSIEAGGIFWSSADGLISLSSNGQTWITIADKNLGATTVWNSGDTLSEANCGKYYQRGNNYGFPRTGSVTTSSTQVDASTYGPGNYYSSSTFITRNSSPYRWDTTDNGNLWGGETGIQPIIISGNLVLGDKLYKIVTSTTAPASGTASNIITIVTD